METLDKDRKLGGEAFMAKSKGGKRMKIHLKFIGHVIIFQSVCVK